MNKSPDELMEAIRARVEAAADQQTPQTDPTPTEANPSINPALPRMANFLEEVVQQGNPAGAGQGVVNALNGMLQKGMEVGFSQEQATRATAFWIIDLMWRTLFKSTALPGQTFLTLVIPQAANEPAPTPSADPPPSSPVPQQEPKA